VQDRRWQRIANFVGSLVWLVPFAFWREEVRQWHWLQVAGVIVAGVLLGMLVVYRAPLKLSYLFPRREVFKLWALLALAILGLFAVIALISTIAGPD